jgi:hypothetical protein
MSHAHTTFRGTAFLLLSLCIALAGCANQMEPAKKALADIQSAIAAVGPDAQRYIPDDLKAVTDQLAGLKAKFDQKDYAAVIAGAPALLAKAQGLMAAKDTAVREATAREAAEKLAAEQALKADWESLAAAVPAAVTAIDSRLKTLTKSKRLPANVTKDALASAQKNLADAKSLWEQASAAQAAGKLDDAVKAAQQANAKANEARVGLGKSAG